jgi:hypothetical protein
MATASVGQGGGGIESGDYRRISYEIWEAMAPGWERWHRSWRRAWRRYARG